MGIRRQYPAQNTENGALPPDPQNTPKPFIGPYPVLVGIQIL